MSDYVRHVLHPDPERDDQTWCGKGSVLEWCFADLDHAVRAVERQCELVPCPDCVDAAVRLLKRLNEEAHPCSPPSSS